MTDDPRLLSDETLAHYKTNAARGYLIGSEDILALLDHIAAQAEQTERAEKAEAERDINGRLADDWRAEAFREKARADAAEQREADLTAKITALADDLHDDDIEHRLRAITEGGAR